MSKENVELIQRGLEHFAETGEPIWDDMSETLVLHDHQSPDQDEYFGHDGWRRWIEDWSTAWTEWNIEVEEVIDAGDSGGRPSTSSAAA